MRSLGLVPRLVSALVGSTLLLPAAPLFAQENAAPGPTSEMPAPGPAAPGATPGPALPTAPSTPDAPGAPADQPGALPGDPGSLITGHGTWRYIVIHHSASPGGNAAAFDRLHRAKGWDGVAYHFVITNGHGGPDGGLQISPRWWAQKHGAHAGALPVLTSPDDRNCYNEFGIGICLVGNFEHHPPTHRQLVTLAHLIEHLQAKFQIPAENIMGHRHVKSTACPGGDFPWREVFSLAKLPAPQHLYRHYAAATHERCPWCQQRGYVPATRVATRHPVPAEPPLSHLKPAAVAEPLPVSADQPVRSEPPVPAEAAP